MLMPFIDNNKAVFAIEYSGLWGSVCPESLYRRFSQLYKAWDLTSYPYLSCQGVIPPPGINWSLPAPMNLWPLGSLILYCCCLGLCVFGLIGVVWLILGLAIRRKYGKKSKIAGTGTDQDDTDNPFDRVYPL